MLTFPICHFSTNPSHGAYYPVDPDTALFLYGGDLNAKGHIMEVGGGTHLLGGGPTEASFLFDGIDDYLTTPDNVNFSFGNNNFCVEYWIKRGSTGLDNMYICGQANEADDATNRLAFGLFGGAPGISLRRSGSSIMVSSVSPDTITDTNWHHIAHVREGDWYITYVDGHVKIGSLFALHLIDGTGNFSVGRAGVYNSKYFKGEIQDLQITKGSTPYVGAVSFTPATRGTASKNRSNCVLLLKARGDESPDKKTYEMGAGVKGSADTAFDYMNSVGVLSGATTFAPASDDFTIDTWFYTDTITGACDVLGGRTGVTTTTPFLIFRNAANLSFYCEGGVIPGWDVLIPFTLSLSAGTWYHLAGTREGDVFRTYLNGTFVDTKTQVVSLHTVVDLGIGGIPSYQFDGKLDKTRIILGKALWTGTGSFTPPSRT